MINRGGEKIYSLEVENVLYMCPGVEEAAVFGIPHPVFGEVPAARLVPLPGAEIDPERIREFVPRPSRGLQGPGQSEDRGPDSAEPRR